MPDSPSDCRHRLLTALQNYHLPGPFSDLVTGTEDSPEKIRGFDVNLHKDTFDHLKMVCESYRLNADLFTNRTDKKCRSVIILGTRGSGKTTLAYRLQKELTNSVILCPGSYQANKPFPRYLLQELVSFLAKQKQSKLLVQIADRLAAEVLYQQLASFTEFEWIRRATKYVKPRGLLPLFLRRDWIIHWGLGTQRIVRIRRDFRQTLQPSNGQMTLKHLYEKFPNYDMFFRELVDDYIRQSESAVDMEGVIRSGLYLRIAQLGFANQMPSDDEKMAAVSKAREEILNFLNDGYTSEYRGILTSPERAVETLLQSIVRLLHFQGLPVIVLFDAIDADDMLELPPSPERCEKFFGQLATFLDDPYPICFLIFSEDGFWNNIKKYQSEKDQQRIRQGVEFAGGTTMSTIQLQHDGNLVLPILQKRLCDVHKYLSETVPECKSTIGDSFPFSNDDIEQVRSRGAISIRAQLEQLRDRYNELVVPPNITLTEQSLVEKRRSLADEWEECYAMRKKDMEPNLSGMASDVIGAVVEWFNILSKSKNAPQKIGKAERIDFGASSYEEFIFYEWRENEQKQHCALGFLLGYRRGQSTDLQKKLLILSKQKKKYSNALILWPKDDARELDPPFDKYLAKGTKSVWTDLSSGIQVFIQPVSPEAILRWLVSAKWWGQVHKPDENNIDEKITFLQDKTADLITLINPNNVQ